MQDLVFDTSALYALLHHEPEFPQVEKLLNQALKKSISISASDITLMELEYGLIREKGVQVAQETMTYVLKLPVEFISISRNLLSVAASFKSSGKISLADAIIAATAKIKEVPLFTKDPEFLILKNEIQVELL